MAQIVKHLPAIRETQVRSLGWEDLLGKEMATHCSIPEFLGFPLRNMVSLVAQMVKNLPAVWETRV